MLNNMLRTLIIWSVLLNRLSLRYRNFKKSKMSGFGTGLKEKAIKTKLYRKVSGENLTNEGQLCFSTDQSIELSSHGDFCLLLDSKLYQGMYDNCDADAGKNFGYDEFRVDMSFDELLQNLECIVVPNEWTDAPDIEYAEGEDPFEWIENLENYGRVIAARDYQEKMNFNF